MRPPRATDDPGLLARYTPDSRRWRRLVAAVAAVAAPLAGYAALAIISGVKSGIAYNVLIAVFGILALTLPAVAATVLLAPDSGLTRGESATETDSVETLKRRYAAGEIDESEFERRLDTLVETEATGGGSDGDTGDGRSKRREEVESVRG